MGKPDKKGAEQQQAGAGKLSLGPLVSKAGKVAGVAANRQQLLGKSGTAAGDAPTSMAAVKQALEQQLKDLSKSLEQQATKTQIAGTEGGLLEYAQPHINEANQMLASAQQDFDKAQDAHNERLKKLDQMKTETSGKVTRSQKELQANVEKVKSAVAQNLDALKRKIKA